MAIAKQPTAINGRQNGKAVEQFISRAGNSQPRPQQIALTVRVSPEILASIDARVKARRVRTPRHVWLLEAILDKLDTEGK